jgi:hypothetical protein
MQDSLKLSIKIVKELLHKKSITQENDRELYGEYLSSSLVESSVDEILNEFGLKIYKYDNGLYITAGMENKVFGYSNEELRDAFKVDSNKHLYLAYFVMYTVVTTFYKETSFKTPVLYVKNNQIVDKVTEKLAAIAQNREIEDREESFTLLNKEWDALPLFNNRLTEENLDRIDKISGSGSQFALVNMVLKFMEDEGLLRKNKMENNYIPTNRLSAIVSNYYDERDTRSILIELYNQEMGE